MLCASQVLLQTEGFLNQVLSQVAERLHSWRVSVRKMKHIYQILNMCSVRERCLIGEVWCPVNDLPRLQGALARASVRYFKNPCCVLTGWTFLHLDNTSSDPYQMCTFFNFKLAKLIWNLISKVHTRAGLYSGSCRAHFMAVKQKRSPC